MSFGRKFPATTRLLKKLTSHPARLVYLGLLGIVMVPGIGLRLEAALFERRVLQVMSVLSSLRIGVTPKAEVLSRMAGFKVNEHYRNKLDCDADECLWVAVSSPRISGWALQKAGWGRHKTLFTVLSWWGLRSRGLGAHVNLTAGKVSSVGYMLVLSTLDPDGPGAVVVHANSTISAARFTGIVADENPNYQVSHAWKWPAFSTKVYFTRDASPELTRHAFDLKLQCVWSIAGCRTANQLLPEAEQDRLRIEHAAKDRMQGPNQCPDWILPGRARDLNDILLVEVKNSVPAFVADGNGTHYRRANLRLLRIFKGKPRRQLDNVLVASEIWPGVRAHNRAFDLLNPGQKLLLFSGESVEINEPCEAVAATDSAVQAIEKFLASAEP